jgi:hypothetical protein
VCLIRGGPPRPVTGRGHSPPPPPPHRVGSGPAAPARTRSKIPAPLRGRATEAFNRRGCCQACCKGCSKACCKECCKGCCKGCWKACCKACCQECCKGYCKRANARSVRVPWLRPARADARAERAQIEKPPEDGPGPARPASCCSSRKRRRRRRQQQIAAAVWRILWRRSGRVGVRGSGYRGEGRLGRGAVRRRNRRGGATGCIRSGADNVPRPGPCRPPGRLAREWQVRSGLKSRRSGLIKARHAGPCEG